MVELPEVGPWAKDKLNALARYLDFYTKVLKNQRWQTIYIDAYAGGGRAIIRAEERSQNVETNLFGEALPIDPDEHELIDGSPRVALTVTNIFDQYIFIDPDAHRITELKALKAEFGNSRKITVLPLTATEGIEQVTGQPIHQKTHRGVAFLDPFGANLDWTSIQKLASTGLFEVVINFPLNMAIQRMLPNSGEVPAGWAARLDRYFGSHAWFQEVYQKKPDGLFADTGYEKRPDYSERLLNLYRSSLKSAFGHVSVPRLIRNTRGAPLYYLLWAGPNKKGLQGADYILTMGEQVR